jgi:hypothetical protein
MNYVSSSSSEEEDEQKCHRRRRELKLRSPGDLNAVLSQVQRHVHDGLSCDISETNLAFRYVTLSWVQFCILICSQSFVRVVGGIDVS